MKKSISLTLAMLMACSLFVGCKDHEHTYADEWKSDATKHWRESTCDEEDDCGDAITDIDGHVDANKDGACDVCAYVVCAHEYATEWSFDATNHWHAATCGCDVKKDEAAHTANAAGVACSVCGAAMTPDVSDVAKALAVATAQKSNVVGGEIAIPREENSGLVTYEFGNSYLHVTDTVGTYVDEYYYSLDANGDLFAVTVDGDGNVINYGAVNAINEVKYLEGYYFAMLSGYIGEAYGVEDLLNVLYEIGVDDANGDFVATVTEGVYSYSFMYYYEGDLMDVSVSFELNESNYAVEKANVSVDVYGSIHFDEEWNAIPNYQETEAGSGVYELLEGAEGSNYTYEITQEFENVVENPYVADDLLITSFKAVDAQGNEIGDEVTVKRSMDGNSYYTYIYLAEVLPETAVIGLNNVTVTGEAIDIDLYATATTDDYGVPCLILYSGVVGEYDVVVSVNGIEKALTVKVEQPAPAELNAMRWTYVVEENDWGVFNVLQSNTVSEIVAVVGEAVYVGATVDYGDSAYTATSATEDLLTAETLSDDNYNEVAAYQVDTSVAGEYEITFTSTAASTVTATVKVTVIDMADVLNGEYRYQEDGVNVYKVAFTPNADGATEGTFDMTYQFYEDSEWKAYSAQYAYAWTAEDGFEVSLVNGYDFEQVVELSANGDIRVGRNTLEKVTAENQPVGVWTYEGYDAEWNLITYSMTLNADGTGKFEATDTVINFKWTATAVDGEEDMYNVAFAANADATDVGTSTAFSVATASATLGKAFSWTTYEFCWQLFVDNGEVDEWDNAIEYSYAQVTGEEAYAWPVELTVGDKTNVYADQYNEVETAKELFINAEQAGTYTVSVCNYDEMYPIATLDEYYFIVNDMKVVGALTFEVEEAERINLAFMFVNAEGDFDIYVDFVAAPTDDDDDNQGGGNTVNYLYDGNVVVVDNNNGAYGGTYYYVEADGVFTIYDETGVVTTDIAIAGNDTDGYTFSCGGLASAQALVAQEGQATLTGLYYVNFVLPNMYELTFTEMMKYDGNVVVVDNNNGAYGGTYYYVEADGVFTIYDETGVVTTDIAIAGNDTDGYTFSCGGLASAQALVAQEGQATLTGLYYVNFVLPNMYELTFTPGATNVSGGEGSGTDVLTLDNSVALTLESYQDSQTVTVGDVETNTYVISVNIPAGPAAGNIAIYVAYGNTSITLDINNSFASTITVEAGATLTVTTSAGMPLTEYSLSLAENA